LTVSRTLSIALYILMTLNRGRHWLLRRLGPRVQPYGVDDNTALDALAELRAHTRQRIEALCRQVNAITEASQLTTHDDEHDPEGATVGFERAQAQSLLAAARRDLAAVDHAERRVRAGSYLTCERCGGHIAEQRIIALPTASTCIACASRPRR
jgi:DnaK suppressor protein